MYQEYYGFGTVPNTSSVYQSVLVISEVANSVN